MLSRIEAARAAPAAAEQLIVSLNTVRLHVKSIYAKLAVDNRTAALEKARSMDLL